MDKPKVRVVRVPLNKEQRETIRNQTGEDVTEAIFATTVTHDEPLENEFLGKEAEALGDVLWSGNAVFCDKITGSPGTKESFERYAEHNLDPRFPSLTILR